MLSGLMIVRVQLSTFTAGSVCLCGLCSHVVRL